MPLTPVVFVDNPLAAVADARTLSFGTIAILATDVLVVGGLTESNGSPLGTPAMTGVTWTQQLVDTTASHTYASIWTGVVNTPGSVAATWPGAFAGNKMHGGVLGQYPNAQLAATPASNATKVGTATAPSATVTTVAAGSSIPVIVGDWTAADGATRAWRSSATEDSYSRNSGLATFYFAHQDAAAAGSQTIGLTTPASMTWTMLGLEVKAATAVVKQPAPLIIPGVAVIRSSTR